MQREKREEMQSEMLGRNRIKGNKGKWKTPQRIKINFASFQMSTKVLNILTYTMALYYVYYSLTNLRLQMFRKFVTCQHRPVT